MSGNAPPQPRPTGDGPYDASTLDELFVSAYRDLRQLARRRLGSGVRPTLVDTTALVHESYLRLAAAGVVKINDRSHFLCYAARAMRSILVDLIRKRNAERHGGQAARIALDTGIAQGVAFPESEILAIHEALDRLEKLDSRMVRIVEMRYFAGMKESEIAGILGLTDRTVRREWEKARLWLAAALEK